MNFHLILDEYCSMKKLLTLYTSLICILCVYQLSLADEITEENNDYDHAEHFELSLERSHETYLVCITKADLEPREGFEARGWSQTRCESTIVQVIKGKRAIGETFNCVRVMDAKLVKTHHLPGELYYVMTYYEEGSIKFDTQNPEAMWKYELKLADTLNKRIAEEERKQEESRLAKEAEEKKEEQARDVAKRKAQLAITVDQRLLDGRNGVHTSSVADGDGK